MGRQRTTKIDEAQAEPSSGPAQPTWTPQARSPAATEAAAAWYWIGSHGNPIEQNAVIGSLSFQSYSGFSGGADGSLEGDFGMTDLMESAGDAPIPTGPESAGVLLPGTVVELRPEQLARLEQDLCFEYYDLRATPAVPRGFRAVRMREVLRRMLDGEFTPAEGDRFELEMARGFGHRRREELLSVYESGSLIEQEAATGGWDPARLLPAGAFAFLFPLPPEAVALLDLERRMWRPGRMSGIRRFHDDRLPEPLRRLTPGQCREYELYLRREGTRFMRTRMPEPLPGGGTIEWVGKTWQEKNPFSSPDGYTAYLRKWGADATAKLDTPTNVEPEAELAPPAQEGEA